MQSEADARAGALHLSERGREVLQAALALHNMLNSQLKAGLAGFTEEAPAVVARFLIHASQLQFSLTA